MVQPGETDPFDSNAAPTCAVDGTMRAPVPIESVRGRLTHDAPLAKFVWFKSGGHADWLFEPADLDDLKGFFERLGGDIPLMALGVGSNMIIRDGGVPGVVVRLGEPFSDVEVTGPTTLRAGAGAPASKVARRAAKAGIDGLAFLTGIPGSVGGAIRMNAGGAYGEIGPLVEWIERIDPGSPARDAGLRTGDVLVRIGGLRVWTPEDVARVLAERSPGESVAIEARRYARRVKTEATLVGAR